MAEVFISYSSKDKKVADAACAIMEESKIRCWIAPRDISPGKDYAESLIDAIAKAKVFVLIFSGNSNESQQVLREVERAVSRGISILPFRIEDVIPTKSMEYFLSAPHWLDAMVPPLDHHLVTLSESVQNLLETSVQKNPTSRVSESKEKAEQLQVKARRIAENTQDFELAVQLMKDVPIVYRDASLYKKLCIYQDRVITLSNELDDSRHQRRLSETTAILKQLIKLQPSEERWQRLLEATPMSEAQTSQSKNRVVIFLAIFLSLIAIGSVGILARYDFWSPKVTKESKDSISRTFDTYLQTLKDKPLSEIPFDDLEELQSKATSQDAKQRASRFISGAIAERARLAEEQLSALTDKFNSLKVNSELTLPKLEELASSVKMLRENDYPILKEPLLGQVTKLADAIRQEESAIHFEMDLKDIAARPIDAPEFYVELGKLVTRHSNAATSRGYRKSLDEQSLSVGVEAWNSFFRSPAFENPQELGSAAAGMLKVRGDELAEKYPIDVFTDLYFQKREFLNRIAARIDFVKDYIHLALSEYLSNQLYTDLYEVRLKHSPPLRYYLKQDPVSIEVKNGRKEIHYILESILKRKKKKVAITDIAFEGIAPHCTLASEIRERIDNASKLQTTGWNPAFVSVVKRIREEREAEPILKALFLEKALSIGCDGSLAFEKGFADHKRMLKEAIIDPGTYWFDPDNDAAAGYRQTATNLLQRLPSVEDSAKEAQRLQLEFYKPPRIIYHRIAWLKRDPNDQGWHAAGLVSECPDGPVYMVIKSSPGSATLKEVGSIKSHVFHFKSSVSSQLQEGRQLFLKEK